MRLILTLGYSTRSLDEFLRVLSSHHIAAIADVRSIPRSDRHPHFSQDTLSKALADHGIDYHWLGESLGGFRKGGFTKYMQTGDFEEGLRSLEELARKTRTAILCAEADHRKCHRRFIADALAERGWRVQHIVDGERIQKHESRGTQGEIF